MKPVLTAFLKKWKIKGELILNCNCTDQTGENRIQRRLMENIDPSEATVEIRNKQKSIPECQKGLNIPKLIGDGQIRTFKNLENIFLHKNLEFSSSLSQVRV